MPSIHPVRAWIAVTAEEWTRFRALATIAGKDGAHLLAELVRGELSRQGVQLGLDEPVYGLGRETETTVRLRRTARLAPKAAPARKRPSKATGAPVTPRRRRKGLPVVSEAELAKADAAGRRKRPSSTSSSTKARSRRRGTIAVEGADQHDAAIAKANKRSVSTKKGRPTRERSS